MRNSVLSQDVRVNSYSELDSTIVFSHVNIGRHCRIRKAIIDRDVHLPEGTVIGYDPERGTSATTSSHRRTDSRDPRLFSLRKPGCQQTFCNQFERRLKEGLQSTQAAEISPRISAYPQRPRR